MQELNTMISSGSIPGEAADGDEIYDLDNTPIYVIFDADYTPAIKEAIAELVNFREDCMFFRDIGRGFTNIVAIKEEADAYTKISLLLPLILIAMM